MNERNELDPGELLKGAVAGAIGVWVKNRVDWAAYRAESAEARMQTIYARPGGMDPAHVIADVALRTFGVPMPYPPQHNIAGKTVEYGLGILPGVLYAALRPQTPWMSKGGGALFGAAMFLLQDELLNPLLGTAAPPQRYPWSTHARGLLSHVVYGVTTHNAMRFLDRAFPPRPRISRNTSSSRALPRTDLPTADPIPADPAWSNIPMGT